MNFDQAAQIAVDAHVGQTDKLHVPYIVHVMAVVTGLEFPDSWGFDKRMRTRVVAVLHDVVEDTTISMEDLVGWGLGDDEAAALDAVTHVDGEPHVDYLDRVCGDDMATVVKLSDARHNLSRVDLIADPATRDRLRGKYMRTILRCSKALHAPTVI